MDNLFKIEFEKKFNIYIHIFLLSMIAYGFPLANYTLSIDNETPTLSDVALENGRWGQNLIRFQLFEGHLQYFTLLLSLFLFSLTAVRLAKLFRFEGIYAYFFCGLFITLPQISYQVVFYMMADIAGLGMFLSVISVEIFIKHIKNTSKIKSIIYLLIASLIIVFLTSLYQILILVPVTIYVIYFFQNTFNKEFNFKYELKILCAFCCLLLISSLLYYLSVKIFCPPIQSNSYLMSFTTGNSKNMFTVFYELLKDNLLGNFYYGEKLYIIVLGLFFILIIKFLFERNYFFIRLFVLFFLIITPFLVSMFISNGYNPPRLYVTSSIVFAFMIVFTIKLFKINITSHFTTIIISLIIVSNIYFITNLFNTCNRIYLFDKRSAEKMYDLILRKYPNFETTEKIIYFYGFFDFEYHQKFRLDKSEIFGGSIFNWGEGDNYRLNNFFRLSNIVDSNMITKEKYESIKDSVNTMPVWPNNESIKMINGVIIVKLGQKKGAKLYFE